MKLIIILDFGKLSEGFGAFDNGLYFSALFWSQGPTFLFENTHELRFAMNQLDLFVAQVVFGNIGRVDDWDDVEYEASTFLELETLAHQ
ncbi:hypothetical protein C7I85_29495 [Mesorhizobium soli]|uniref:Uncharacterized protein n=1 Tax=Pseudaminobacter soli (ex Li et al. 2025) TaxID=1295366 RepID=A0A2P7RMI9_9HYPH|nr:hypothetical protein C7I85_29495 [Mesorhizobium soli]